MKISLLLHEQVKKSIYQDYELERKVKTQEKKLASQAGKLPNLNNEEVQIRLLFYNLEKIKAQSNDIDPMNCSPSRGQ